MNRLLLVGMLLITHNASRADDGSELRRAKYYGADAKVMLRCVNQDGHAVSNAYVSSGFTPDGSFERAVACNGMTDEQGIYSVAGKSNGELMFAITKEGYYRTQGHEFLYKRPDVFVSNGRWQPYGMTNMVILKRQVHPVAMCVKSNRDGLQPPTTNEFVGFDLERGAWVQPYGQGLHGDIVLKFEYRAGKLPLLYYRGAVLFSFTNRFDGAYVAKKETFSAFMSAYQADTNAIYQQNLAFIYDRLSGTIVENSKLSDSEYIVLRIRSRVDATGNLVSAHYAKIYGPIAAGGGGIYMNFYFNPNTNDPNLEADTSRNLLNSSDLGFPP